MNRRSNTSSIDWLELDRLVGGRLNGDEYRQLLCQIDSDPEGWKQCALAFLEHQALEKELGAFAADPSCQLLPGMGALVADATQGKDLVGDPIGVPKESFLKKSSAMVGWLSMSLCVVGGLAIGFTMNSAFKDRLPPREGSPVVAAATLVSDSSTASRGDESSSKNLGVTDDGSCNDQLGEAKCRSKTSCSSQRHRYSLQNRRRNMEQHDLTTPGLCPMFQRLQDQEDEE